MLLLSKFAMSIVYVIIAMYVAITTLLARIQYINISTLINGARIIITAKIDTKYRIPLNIKTD